MTEEPWFGHRVAPSITSKIYDRFPTLSPEEAAHLIAEAIRKRPKRIATTLGNIGQLSYAVAPGAQDLVATVPTSCFPRGATATPPRSRPTARPPNSARSHAPPAASTGNER
jgi:hypothetical protein